MLLWGVYEWEREWWEREKDELTECSNNFWLSPETVSWQKTDCFETSYELISLANVSCNQRGIALIIAFRRISSWKTFKTFRLRDIKHICSEWFWSRYSINCANWCRTKLNWRKDVTAHNKYNHVRSIWVHQMALEGADDVCCTQAGRRTIHNMNWFLVVAAGVSRLKRTLIVRTTNLSFAMLVDVRYPLPSPRANPAETMALIVYSWSIVRLQLKCNPCGQTECAGRAVELTNDHSR